MGLVVFAIIVAGVIYLIIRTVSHRVPGRYNPPPVQGYGTTPMMEPILPVENPLVDLAVFAAAELGTEVIVDSFVGEPPQQDPGFGGGDMSQDPSMFGGNDGFDSDSSGFDSFGGSDGF